MRKKTEGGRKENRDPLQEEEDLSEIWSSVKNLIWDAEEPVPYCPTLFGFSEKRKKKMEELKDFSHENS